MENVQAKSENDATNHFNRPKPPTPDRTNQQEKLISVSPYEAAKATAVDQPNALQGRTAPSYALRANQAHNLAEVVGATLVPSITSTYLTGNSDGLLSALHLLGSFASFSAAYELEAVLRSKATDDEGSA